MTYVITFGQCMELLCAGFFMGVIIGAAISIVAHKGEL